MITAGFTGYLSILDTVVNFLFKVYVKQEFRNWCSLEIANRLIAGERIVDINLDLGKRNINQVFPGWCQGII